MTDENTPHSGSRWEPATVATPRQPAAADPSPTPTAPRRRRRALGARRRGAFAGAAVGLVAAGGLGGFALGHAAAGGTGGQTGQVSQLPTSDDHPALPGGRPPSRGSLPGQPPSGDLDGDLDGDGGLGGSGDDDQGGGSGTTQPGSPA